MRREEFKMERENLVKVGDEVEIIERSCPANYHYIIEPAVAMSGCYQERERIQSTKGIVKEINETARGFYVIVEFDE
ncbi:MAG: hypothetical protein HFI75_15290 [Lachnospiraceae bacterium]|nr:hypothetical protein [Lachnospiraceae bacterium]